MAALPGAVRAQKQAIHCGQLLGRASPTHPYLQRGDGLPRAPRVEQLVRLFEALEPREVSCIVVAQTAAAGLLRIERNAGQQSSQCATCPTCLVQPSSCQIFPRSARLHPICVPLPTHRAGQPIRVAGAAAASRAARLFDGAALLQYQRHIWEGQLADAVWQAIRQAGTRAPTDVRHLAACTGRVRAGAAFVMAISLQGIHAHIKAAGQAQEALYATAAGDALLNGTTNLRRLCLAPRRLPLAAPLEPLSPAR